MLKANVPVRIFFHKPVVSETVLGDDTLCYCLSLPLTEKQQSPIGAVDLFFKNQAHCVFYQQQNELNSAIAQLISSIISRGQIVMEKKVAVDLLTTRVDEQLNDLKETHLMLTKALAQRDELKKQRVDMEKAAAIGTMLSSVTHEMNTPVGVSLTAISHLQHMRAESQHALLENNLKKSELLEFYRECEEACKIAERNLSRATGIVETFKQLGADQFSAETRLINLSDYICELLLSLKPTLKKTLHKICLDVDPDLVFESYPSAIGQILINFIINSVQHGFTEPSGGRIIVRAYCIQVDKQLNLVLKYSDNGKGMDEYTRRSIYRPFFTQAKEKGGTGLGMHICYNLAVNMLHGSIECESKESIGTCFTLQFPIIGRSGFSRTR